MAFWIYKTSEISGGTEYEWLDEISLAGNRNGLIYRTLIARGHIEERWHITEAEMLETAGLDADHHALVIDMVPKEVEMYRIKEIWGFSYSKPMWSPLLISLDYIYSETSTDPDTEKCKFIPNVEGPVFEFLYLRGGINEGTWGGTWNFPQGTITGALLFKDALDYFLEILKKERSSQNNK